MYLVPRLWWEPDYDPSLVDLENECDGPIIKCLCIRNLHCNETLEFLTFHEFDRTYENTFEMELAETVDKLHEGIMKMFGKEHVDKVSIPQGCPFSMTMIALVMRPWIQVMEKAGVTPRVLADDLMLFTEGPNHGQKAIDAMQLSRDYFQDVGAKVAEKKCYLSFAFVVSFCL